MPAGRAGHGHDENGVGYYTDHGTVLAAWTILNFTKPACARRRYSSCFLFQAQLVSHLPSRGLIGLFNRFPPFKCISGVRLDKAEEKCTKCGVCKRVCPTQVTKVYEAKSGDAADSQCLMCLRCVEMCPEKDCLKFKFVGKTVCKSRNWLEKP